MKRLLIVLLLLVPMALPGLAQASPPDPSWIPGIYANDDGDAVEQRLRAAPGVHHL